MDREPQDGRLRRLGLTAWSLLGALLLVGAILWILSRISFLLPSVVLAIAIIYVLNPVVSKLQIRGVARWIGSCVSYLVVLGLLILLGFLVIPSIADQGRDLADNFPEIYDDLILEIEGFGDGVGLNLDLPRYDEVRQNIEDSQGDFLSDRLGQITDITLSVLETALLIILAPVIAFYVLLDLPGSVRPPVR